METLKLFFFFNFPSPSPPHPPTTFLRDFAGYSHFHVLKLNIFVSQLNYRMKVVFLFFGGVTLVMFLISNQKEYEVHIGEPDFDQ